MPSSSFRREELLVAQDPDRVALARNQMRKRGRGHASVPKLRVRALGKRHRRAGVDDHYRREVRRLAKLLGVDAIGAGNELPVHVLQIVAGTIVTVLAELGAVTVKRTAMQAGHEAFSKNARHELEVADSAQKTRVEYAAGRVRHVTGTDSSSWPTTWSASTPSASAWKLSSTRWRRTGSATARTSSSDATLLPS